MKDISGYEGLYAVTSCGKVWSYRSKIFLKPKDNGLGYLQVQLNKDGNRKNYYIHRLVAEAYIPNPNGLPQVNHLDENRINNCVDNLEWCDGDYNLHYGTRSKKLQQQATKHAVRQYTLDDEFIAEYVSLNEAEKITGVNKGGIYGCCRGERKTAGGYHWKYVS